MDRLIQNLHTLLTSIDLCIANRLILPAVILIYSGIDAVAALESPPGEQVGTRFTRWTDAYLLKAKALPCSATDLYAARCGVLHTFAAESSLSQKGAAVPILYAWGAAKAPDLDQVTKSIPELKKWNKAISIHVNDLAEAFRLGLVDYLESAQQSQNREQLVLSSAGAWLGSLPMSIIESFLAPPDNPGV